MKEKTILTDIDGVVLNWEEAFENYINKHYKIKVKDPTKYQAHLRWPLAKAQLDQVLWHFNMSAWMGYLNPLRDSLNIIKQLNEEGWRFIAITSIHDDEATQKLRESNLKNLYGDVWDKVICLPTGGAKDKALLPWKNSGYLWIEDKFENAQLGADMGLDPILMRHEYNAHFEDVRITKVDNWQQIYYYINKR